MKIKKITSRNRRDFTAIYECENCENTEESRGYDDANFHNNVIPSLRCKKCNKKSPRDYLPIATKYSEDEIV